MSTRSNDLRLFHLASTVQLVAILCLTRVATVRGDVKPVAYPVLLLLMFFFSFSCTFSFLFASILFLCQSFSCFDNAKRNFITHKHLCNLIVLVYCKCNWYWRFSYQWKSSGCLCVSCCKMCIWFGCDFELKSNIELKCFCDEGFLSLAMSTI